MQSNRILFTLQRKPSSLPCFPSPSSCLPLCCPCWDMAGLEPCCSRCFHALCSPCSSSSTISAGASRSMNTASSFKRCFAKRSTRLQKFAGSSWVTTTKKAKFYGFTPGMGKCVPFRRAAKISSASTGISRRSARLNGNRLYELSWLCSPTSSSPVIFCPCTNEKSMVS